MFKRRRVCVSGHACLESLPTGYLSGNPGSSVPSEAVVLCVNDRRARRSRSYVTLRFCDCIFRGYKRCPSPYESGV